MFGKKKLLKDAYLKKVKLLAEKVLWIKEHHKVNVLLLTDIDKEHNFELVDTLYNSLLESQKLSISITPLLATESNTEEIDWDHDLNIIYLDDLNNNPHLPAISNYIDYSLLLVKSSSSSRHQIKKCIDILASYKITLSACVLHQFREKVPNIIKRIFF